MLMKLSSIALVAALAAIAGCGKPNLYVAHDTVIGINAAVNAARTSGRLVVGYDRDFVTLIPVSVKQKEGDSSKGENHSQSEVKAREAMSVVSCSKLQVSGIWLSEFTERLTTGSVAQLYAQKLLQSEADPFSCSKEGEEPDDQQGDSEQAQG